MIIPFRSPERRLGPFRLLLEYVSGLFPVDQVFRSEYRIVGSPFGGSPCCIISIVNPYDGRVGDVPANNGISEIGLFLGILAPEYRTEPNKAMTSLFMVC